MDYDNIIRAMVFGPTWLINTDHHTPQKEQ